MIVLNKHTKKLIAPIVITILIVLYFIFYMSIGFIVDAFPLIIRIIMIVVPMGFMILAVYMLYERIQEIKGGEEDDLSKY